MIEALVPSVSIDALVMKRDTAAERIRAAHDALVEANALMDTTLAIDGDPYQLYHVSLSCRRTHTDFLDDERGVEAQIKAMDAHFWDRLLKLSGLYSFMDAKARDAWRDSISKRDVPALTKENIEATFAKLYAGRALMFEQGVINVFRSLSWDYKRNEPVKLGRRVVLSRIVDTWAGKAQWSWARPSFDGANQLDDLLRVFHVLDGKPEPDHREASHAKLAEAKWPQCGSFTLDGYIALRGFKNGNAHATFERQDLVDKLNAIIAKHYPGALPPAREE